VDHFFSTTIAREWVFQIEEIPHMGRDDSLNGSNETQFPTIYNNLHLIFESRKDIQRTFRT